MSLFRTCCKYLFLSAKIVNSLKEGLFQHCKRWPRIRLSLDGFVFLKVRYDIPICSPYLIFKYLTKKGFNEFTILAHGK